MEHLVELLVEVSDLRRRVMVHDNFVDWRLHHLVHYHSQHLTTLVINVYEQAAQAKFKLA